MGLKGIPKREDNERALDVLERVTLAVETLCVAKGDVRSRLVSAVGDLIPLREQDFPLDLPLDSGELSNSQRSMTQLIG